MALLDLGSLTPEGCGSVETLTLHCTLHFPTILETTIHRFIYTTNTSMDHGQYPWVPSTNDERIEELAASRTVNMTPPNGLYV